HKLFYALLELIKGNIESLYGIENNYNLSKISIFYIKSLRSLYPNENKNSTISDIEINGCTNIVDLGDLVTFRNVRKLILDNIGNLTSVKFISEFKELNYFVLLGSVIEDGDVSPCFGIDYVQFEEKDWYSHTFSEFKKLNGIEKRKRKISR
ncbi:hypothetical protein P5F74_14740, partial [Shouchella miscanthi]|nr:hypothetical protein [Shouchella miscanthi]